MSESKTPAPVTNVTGGALHILQEGIDGAQADMQSDADAGERVDLFEYEISLPYETAMELAALLRAQPPENHLSVPASMLEDGSPLVTDLIREFERARRQWDKFQKTGVSTAAVGSYDLCFSAVLKKHLAPAPVSREPVSP